MQALAYKVAVIGGGASGMMATLSASRLLPSGSVLLLEKNSVLGKKISATGNGRCNFTNRLCKWEDYGGGDISMVRHAFDHLNPAETIALFWELGVLAREESSGRIYPYSEQAACITEAFKDEIRCNRVDIRLDSEVTAVKKKGELFDIILPGGSVQAHSLIIATGGKAGHKYGSTGDGYGFAKSFGHTLRRPLPALVRVITDDSFAARLKGVRVKGAVSLMKEQKIIMREEGEMQFTEDGLSGICVFDLSRFLSEEPVGFSLQIDLFPGYSGDELLKLLMVRKKRLSDRPAESLIKGMLNDKLVPVYIGLSGIPSGSTASAVGEDRLHLLSKLLKCREVAVRGTKGWVEAQVTVGGIKSEEVAGTTLESKLVRGLFFAGEVLDIDGKCGGWNLQWAWSSGWAAGFSAARWVLSI